MVANLDLDDKLIVLAQKIERHKTKKRNSDSGIERIYRPQKNN